MIMVNNKEQLHKKLRGCLLGGAAGDALGYPIEFLSLNEITERFGEKGLTEYRPDAQSGKALISDDTQMTLFTANALLFRFGSVQPILTYPGAYAYYHTAYLEWFRLQSGERPGDHHCWLCEVPELAERRAPGITCLSALASGFSGLPEEPINSSRGCGSVMRIAPTALMTFDGPEESAQHFAMREAAAAAAVTHGHCLAWLSAAAAAYLIRRAFIDPYSPAGLYAIAEDCCRALEQEYPKEPAVQEINAILQNAISLARSDLPDRACIARLGEGWTGEEALAVALFCALRHPDNFSDAIIAAANHDGDSDSTAAICGNILGAWLGEDAIDRKWLEKLELLEVICEIADDLYTLPMAAAKNTERMQLLRDPDTMAPSVLMADASPDWSVKYNEGRRPPAERVFIRDGDSYRKEADIALLLTGDGFPEKILRPFLEDGRIDTSAVQLKDTKNGFVCGYVGHALASRYYRFPMYIFIGILKEGARQHCREWPQDAAACRELLKQIERNYS